MSRQGEGMLVALAVIAGVALAAGAVVLARSSGDATIVGTDGPDTLIGTPQADKILGLGGNDLIEGRGGRDVLKGGAGYDTIKGGRGNDRLLAGPDGATLVGGRGRDQFNMRNGQQVDGQGNDLIKARDGTPDEINCGPGNDVAIVDRVEEGVYDCETVIEPSSGQ